MKRVHSGIASDSDTETENWSGSTGSSGKHFNRIENMFNHETDDTRKATNSTQISEQPVQAISRAVPICFHQCTRYGDCGHTLQLAGDSKCHKSNKQFYAPEVVFV